MKKKKVMRTLKVSHNTPWKEQNLGIKIQYELQRIILEMFQLFNILYDTKDNFTSVILVSVLFC